jgi:hypothetical protein
MANRDTVGCAFVTSGLKFGGTHKYSQASNILTTSLVALTLDKTKWPVELREKSVKEIWFKSNVVVTFSQDAADENDGLISFAADTWDVLPAEMNLAITNGIGVKGANATNTTEYFLILGD